LVWPAEMNSLDLTVTDIIGDVRLVRDSLLCPEHAAQLNIAMEPVIRLQPKQQPKGWQGPAWRPVGWKPRGGKL
jgi:hypothetical protein